MRVVDADAHVQEGPATWECLDRSFYPKRPIPLEFPEDTSSGPFNAAWLVEGRIHPQMAGRGWHIFATPMSLLGRQKKIPIGAQDMTDVPARLADMDALGIHYQVVFPTLFLAHLAYDAQLERGLCESYNRFMSQQCAKSGGRIRFAAVVPWHSVEEAICTVREAKELGAVTAMVPAMLGDDTLEKQRFFPLYEELSRLKLPLAVHVAWGSPTLNHLFDDFTHGGFSSFILPTQMAFWGLMIGGIYDRFPDMKVAFLEAGSEWLPYLINQLDRHFERGTKSMKRRPSDCLKQGNIYIAAEAEEDLPYLFKFLPEDCWVLASDYGHGDSSSEEDMVGALKEHQPSLTTAQREKILSANPMRLYDLER